APGVRSLRRFLAAVHHVNLSQAAGARVLRDVISDPVVGTTHYLSPIEPTGKTAFHHRAVQNADALVNRLFIEPNLGLGYPTQGTRFLRGIDRFQRDGDEEALLVDWDFLGVQYYTRLKAYVLPIPGLWTAPIFGHDWRRFDITSTGWEVRPEGLYEVLARAHGYGFPRLVVTENGAAYPDELIDNRVRDKRRIAFYEAHLEQVLRARDAGIPVDGYFCWSLIDNFEWAEGYRARFGIVYVDYPTQRRIVKDSGKWFRQLLTGTNG
ncbi:MAG: family 1 glycosylhydrolase, partial [Acidimicrobiales bacterium]|nr:family 1 glycosylhydrolase [Acidimicrobiales bacterium]